MSPAQWLTNAAAAAVAIIALAGPSSAFAQDHSSDCDKNHYILNYKCWGDGDVAPVSSGEAIKVSIGLPTAVVVDETGNVFFTSSHNAVYRVSPQGQLKRIAGNGVAGFSGDGGPADRAQVHLLNPPIPCDCEWDSVGFAEQNALAVDHAGNLYIADKRNNRIRKVDAQGVMTTVAGRGSYESGDYLSLISDPEWFDYVMIPGDDAYDRGDGEINNAGDGEFALDTSIFHPVGIAVDSAGTLLVVNDNGVLRKITPDGRIAVIATLDPGPDWWCTGLCPWGQIALRADGRLVAPSWCLVKSMSVDGSVVTIAGHIPAPRPSGVVPNNQCPYFGNGVPAKDAGIGPAPGAVAVDTAGNLYIADTSYNCVRQVDTAGTISTVAGSCGGTWMFTGVPLRSPQGIAVDHQGNLYIADTGNARILKRTPDGTMTTIAGLMPAIPLATP